MQASLLELAIALMVDGIVEFITLESNDLFEAHALDAQIPRE
jgi:hypothetical protein